MNRCSIEFILFLLSILGLTVDITEICATDRTSPTTSQTGEVVASVADAAITNVELDELVANRLLRLRTEEYDVKRAAIEDWIARTLMEKEGDRRKVSIEQLTEVEVEGRIRPVTGEETKAVYDSAKGQFAGVTEAEALKQIEFSMRLQRIEQRRQEFIKELRAKGGVKVLLEPPRATIAFGNAPSRGPLKAQVTILEFSDYQCPFCAQADATLRKLQDHYGEKIKFTFHDFPLPSHVDSTKAAEAAACAHEHGKHSEMQQKIYANQQKLQLSELKQYAADIGLEPGMFNSCIDSGKYSGQWQSDREEGIRVGVTSTPTFFINGRMIVGALPYEAFIQLIDEELERTTTEIR